MTMISRQESVSCVVCRNERIHCLLYLPRQPPSPGLQSYVDCMRTLFLWAKNVTRMLVCVTLAQTALRELALERFNAIVSKEEARRANVASRFSSSNERWLLTVLKGGTLNDRLGAMALAIQEDTMKNFRILRQLVDLCACPSRREALQACQIAKDVFLLTPALPESRRLRMFHESLTEYRSTTPVGDIPDSLLAEWCVFSVVWL